MSERYLRHFGIKGMKWGVRRYQNKDGSLTAAGRKRQAQDDVSSDGGGSKKKSASTKSSSQPKKKSVKEMSDAELRDKINRLELEKRYSQLNPEQVSRGKKFVDKVVKDMVLPAATDVGKQLIKSEITKLVNDKLGLEDEYKVFTNNKKK